MAHFWTKNVHSAVGCTTSSITISVSLPWTEAPLCFKKMVLDASFATIIIQRVVLLSKRKHFNFFFNDIFSHQEEGKKKSILEDHTLYILKGSNEIFLTPDKWCPKSFSLSKNDCERRSKQIYEIVKWRHFYQFFQKVLLLTVNPIIDFNLVDEKTYMRSIINSYTNKHYTTQLAQ